MLQKILSECFRPSKFSNQTNNFHDLTENTLYIYGTLRNLFFRITFYGHILLMAISPNTQQLYVIILV